MNGVIVFWITVILLVLVVFTFGSCAKFQACFDCNNTKFGARICVNVSKFGASYKRISDIFHTCLSSIRKKTPTIRNEFILISLNNIFHRVMTDWLFHLEDTLSLPECSSFEVSLFC